MRPKKTKDAAPLPQYDPTWSATSMKSGAGDKSRMVKADGFSPGASILMSVHRSLPTDPGLGTGRPILFVPPKARPRWSVVTSAKPLSFAGQG